MKLKSASLVIVLPLMYAAQAAAAEPEPVPSALEEIVVTAQKRAENIQDVPAAVSSISPDLLSAAHATQLVDISAYVPALKINSAGTPGQTSISIRGIAPVGPGATVATYIDETPLGSSSAYGGGISFALDLLPYDIQRLEVLRGPQGTLYGASSMGGLLKYVLTSPALDQFAARVGADVFGLSGAGDLGRGASATLSGPLLRDTLGFTASYAREDTPGFVDNSATGEKEQNSYRQQSGRLGMAWQPSDALSLKVNALYQQVDSDGNGTIALDAASLQPLAGRLDDNNLTSQPFRKEIQYYSATAEYRASWADFISASSYTDTRTSQIYDASYSWGAALASLGLAGVQSQYSYKLHLQKYTQEFRLQSQAGTKLEWLAGVFATYEDSSNFQSPSATLGGAPIPGVDPIFAAQLPSTYKEYAAFAALTYHLTDRLDLLGGVRRSQNRQVFSEIATSSLLSPVDLRNQKSDQGVTTYSAGAKYRFTDKVMGYVRVASGYQPGGPNLAIPGVPVTFDSDTLTNYEVGVKSQLLDDRVLLDLGAFYIAWNDIQLLSSGAGFSYGTNGGKARSKGFEANASFHPVQTLTLDGTFSYIDAVLTEDVRVIGGLDGDRLPNIPRLSGSLRVTYSHAAGNGWTARVGAGYRMEDRRYSSVNHAFDSRPIGGYGVFDLTASLANERYTARFFAKNLTDKHAYLTYNPQVNAATGDITQIEATVIQPRVIGVALDVKF